MNSKGKQPFVSVVIAVYNRKDLMKRTLDAMLKVGYKNYEIIVADGDSTDGTKEMLFQYTKKYKRLKPIVVKEPGRTIARNKAIKKSRGEIIIFVDSDCIVEKNWMKEIVKPFEDPDVGVVIGRTIADKKGPFWYHMENNDLEFVGHNTAMRASIVKKLGGFNTKFRTAREDGDLAWRVLEKGYKAVYCKTAKMIHVSRRIAPAERVKNQKHYVFDALLKREHPALYKKYFIRYLFSAAIENAIIGVLYVLATAYFLFTNALIGLVMVLAYLAATLYKTAGSDGTIKERIEFLLFIWLLPFSRLFYYILGFVKFRNG